MIRDKIIIVEDDPGISKYLQAALRSTDMTSCWRLTVRPRWR